MALEEALKKPVCPWCAKGARLRQREDTKEWVHDIFEKGSFIHSICLERQEKASGQ